MQHAQPRQETSLPYMHLAASPSPPPGPGPPPISSSLLHFLALARLFSQSHLKLLSPLFLTATKSKGGFRCAVKLCIAAHRALLFCRLSSRDRLVPSQEEAVCKGSGHRPLRGAPRDRSIAQTRAAQPRATHSVRPANPRSPRPAPQAAAASTQEAKLDGDKGPTCVMDPR